jgi:hypothetical protein
VKKVLFTLFSLFLTYFSYTIVVAAAKVSANYSFIEALLIAAILNLCLTGILAFLGFVYPTSRLFPSAYYENINRHRIEKLYKLLGVKHFRVFLLATFWKSKKKRSTYFNGKKSGLSEMTYQSKQAEFGHLVSFIIIGLISMLFIWHLQWNAFFICTFINLIFNFYPVIMQRFLRLRLYRLKRQ